MSQGEGCKREALKGRRVVVVFATLELGGAERQGLHLAEYLKRQGAEVMVAALWGGVGKQVVPGLCREMGVACLRVSMPTWGGGGGEGLDLGSVKQFVRDLRALEPDVVLPYTAAPNVLCGLAWRLAGAKVCVWNQRDEGRELPRGRWQKAAVKNVETVVSNSEEGARFLRETFGVKEVRVIRNGVQLKAAQRTRAQWRQELGIGAEDVAGCMVANLHKYKDHHTLIEAWGRVVQALEGAGKRKAWLLLAGREVEGGAELRALAQRCGVAERVRFLGLVEDVTGLLAAMDVGVHSSRYEGTPNAILEALAVGLPVVATDIAGIREAFPPKLAEWLAAPGAAGEMAGKIVRLLGDAGLREELGKEGRRWVREAFGVKRMGAEMCGLIEQAMAGGEGRG